MRALAPAGLAALAVLAAVPSLVSTGCASAAGSSGAEDKARRDVPIAICRKPLAPANLLDNGGPRPEVYWQVLEPSFRSYGSVLEANAPNCVGDPTVPAPAPAQNETGRVQVAPAQADATVTPVGDGLEIVWLRTSTLGDRIATGPLAIVRPRPAEIDVYTIGLYQGSSHHSRFELLRMGTTMAVIARDESCADVKVETECESVASFYLVSGGQLAAAARTSIERVQFGTMKDVGRVKYRLTTDPPVVEPTAIHVKEHLSVRDSSDDEVRKSEGERVFTLTGGELSTNQNSIWSQLPGSK